MAAISCNECGRDYSDNDIVCPGCGAPRRSRSPSLIELNATGTPSRQFDLTAPECSLGTEPSNDMVLRDTTVSRRHAVIRRLAGSFQVVDLGTTNGTYINDRRISGSANLADGDRVRLGSAKFLLLEPSSHEGHGFQEIRNSDWFRLPRLQGRTFQYLASGVLIVALIGGLYFVTEAFLEPSLSCDSDTSTDLLSQTLNKLLAEQLKGASVQAITNVGENERPNRKREKTCQADVKLRLSSSTDSTKELQITYKISREGNYQQLEVVDQDSLINAVVLDCSSQSTADLLLRVINLDPDNGGMITAVSVSEARDAAPELTASTNGKQRSCNAKLKANVRNSGVSVEFPVSFNLWREGDEEHLQVNNKATLYEMRGFP